MIRLALIALLCVPLTVGAQIRENAYFKIEAPTVVWYGAGAKFTTKSLQAGTHRCDNKTFGDPNYGIIKQCRSTAFEQGLSCYPAQLSGTGSRAAWGVSLSPIQGWAGWWCGDRMQVVACVGDGCKPDVFKRVASTTSETINAELKGARTEHIDSERLKAVWAPNLAQIEAMR